MHPSSIVCVRVSYSVYISLSNLQPLFATLLTSLRYVSPDHVAEKLL